VGPALMRAAAETAAEKRLDWSCSLPCFWMLGGAGSRGDRPVGELGLWEQIPKIRGGGFLARATHVALGPNKPPAPSDSMLGYRRGRLPVAGRPALAL